MADLFKVITNIPLCFVSSLYGEWIFGQIGIKKLLKWKKKWTLNFKIIKGCDFYGAASGFFGFMSIATMTFMAIERFLIVKNPLNSLKITRVIIVGNINKFKIKLNVNCFWFNFIFKSLLSLLGFIQRFGYHFHFLQKMALS